ncbi:MAG: hypothetical protein ACEPOV_10360 [Hyphomicrobiales bacterium]
MRGFLLAVFVFITFFSNDTYSQGEFTTNKYKKNVFFVQFPGSKKQATVIEYKDFLTVLELPVPFEERDEDVKEESENAQKFIAYVDSVFNKPVKYIASSHWHSHTLSGLIPFLDNGAKLFITKSNWEKGIEKGMLGRNDSSKYIDKVVFISKDTVVFQDSKMPLELVYLDESYDVKPTDEYITYYFPKLKTLHASCLYAIRDFDYRKITLYARNPRLQEIADFIKDKDLNIKRIIRLRCNSDKKFVFTYQDLDDYIKGGLSDDEMVSHFMQIDSQVLTTKTDSIINAAVAQILHPWYIFKASTNLIEEGQYKRALALAKLVNLYYPKKQKYINTLGLCYYLIGDIPTAKHYNRFLTGDYGWESWIKEFGQKKKI